MIKDFQLGLVMCLIKKQDNLLEGGKQLLINKLTGYVSYLSGENPFTFPYRIFPKFTGSPKSLIKLQESGWNYPIRQN